MQAEKVDMLAFLNYLDQFLELMLGDAEFVFIQTGRDVFVCVSVDVRIDPDGDAGLDTVTVGHFVDYIYLLK